MIVRITHYQKLLINSLARQFASKGFVPTWATCDPFTLSAQKPYTVQNFVNGQWKSVKNYNTLIDPLNGEKFLKIPDTQGEELNEFITSSKSCPKSGLHNPFKNPERYNYYGDLCAKIAQELRKQEVVDYYSRLIQRVMPKSTIQCAAEVLILRKFFENFSGDSPRFLCKSFNVSGDHLGQQSSGYRWPYGPVAIISPFNFPIEIPALQLFGALLVGNRPLLKAAQKMSIVMEQFLRMCLHLGLPQGDVDFLQCGHKAIEDVIQKADFRVIQFTGSSQVAERLSKMTHGKVKIEDAGFDWKILGPDVSNIDYVTWQADQDAFAASGQKCSAQSIVYAHSNWIKAGFIDKVAQLAKRRKLEDLTIGPVITWDNKSIKKHIDACLSIPGAKLLFGGKPLTGHKIPACYGSYEPTAIFVPIDQILNHFETVTTELFGPFYIITEYNDDQVDLMLQQLEKQQNHLTAAVVTNDPQFYQKIVSNTVNGVTYTGIRARTTGAPQNHWFGPAGDPRAAGIGSPEAILTVWTCHREIITDFGPIPKNWKVPPCN